MNKLGSLLSFILAASPAAQAAPALRAALAAPRPAAGLAPVALRPGVSGAAVLSLAAPGAAAGPSLAPALPSPLAMEKLETAAPVAAPAAAASVDGAPASPEPSPEAAREDAGRRFDLSDGGAPRRDGAPGAAGETPSLSLPARTFTLANGLKVVVHTDKTAPVVAVSVTYHVGSQHEREGLSGFAHLFEHLMAQGTKSIKPREISHIIEGAGGVRNAYTMRSNTTYHSFVPRSALKTVLWAEAERMSTLDVDDRAVALERNVVTEEMRLRYLNAPYAKARDAGMAEAAFSKWENRHTTIGEIEEVRGASLEDVRAFYRSWYAPNNATIALAGDVDEAEARALVERYFGGLERRELPARPDLSEAPLAESVRRVVPDRFAKVPLLMTGWRAPERGTVDYWALFLAAELLGGREDSPIHQALVKDQRLALEADSTFPWWTGPWNPGGPELFGFMLALKPGVAAEAALAAVDRVLSEVVWGSLTERQLAAAKARVERAWTKDFEQLLERAKTLSSYAALVGDPAGLAADFKKLMSVNLEDVRHAVHSWLVTRPRAVVEARPAPELPPAAKLPELAVPDARPRGAGDPRPEPEAQRPMPPPEVSRFTLSNGLDVVATRDPRLPFVEARLSIPGGRLAERPGEEGLSAAAAELLRKGAAGKDAAALALETGELGWTVSVSRGLERVELSASGLSRNAARFFRALGENLAAPSFPEAELALWRENKTQDMKIQRSKPDFMAAERIKAELFGEHPYGRPALTDEQIAAVTRERLEPFRRRALAPRGATLVVAGDVEPESLRAALEAGLSGWTGDAAASAAPALPAGKPARTIVVGRPGSEQANLTVSQAVDLRPSEPDFLAFQVANQILGGSATSRLFVNLRVEKGYTYGSYSSAQALDRGLLWTASAEVRHAVAAPALAEMKKEIARLRDEKVPDATLAAVKRYLAGVFLLKNASIDRKADSIAHYERLGLSPERELATYLARLDALTPDDVQRAARKYLDPDKMVVVAVGDEKALEQALGR